MVKQSKLALNTFDDKRFYVERYQSVPWGTSENGNEDEFIPMKSENKSKQRKINETKKIFINELYAKTPEKNHATNKMDVYYIDNIWNMNSLDLNNNGLKNNKGYRSISVKIDKFSEFDWTSPIKIKNAPTKKFFFRTQLHFLRKKSFIN